MIKIVSQQSIYTQQQNSFGKHRDKPVQSDLDYCQWVMTSDFPADTKVKLKEWIKKKNR